MVRKARKPSFWVWLAFGTGGRSGWTNLVQPWLIFDLIFGFLIGFVFTVNIVEAARAVLFPLVSIFVAVSVAWGSSAHSLLFSKEIKSLSLMHSGGFVEYVYPFQLGLLVILVTISLWAIAALGIDVVLLDDEVKLNIKKIYSVFLFFTVSLSVRVTWQTVCLVLNLLIYSEYIREIIDERSNNFNNRGSKKLKREEIHKL